MRKATIKGRSNNGRQHTSCRISRFLSVLISGNNLIAKTSSKDSELIIYISEILCAINPEFRKKIEFTEGYIYKILML